MRARASRIVFVLALLSAALPAASALRVISYNIHAWRDSEHEDNLEQLCSLLRELRPDVLCLNEVLHPFVPPPPTHPYWAAVRSRRGRGTKTPASSEVPNLERLQAALQLKHAAFGAATEVGSFFGDVPFGNAILSRFPLEGVAHTLMPPEEGDLTLGSQARSPEDLEARGVLCAKVCLPGGASLGIACTHLDHRCEKLRERQARAVCAAADRAFCGGSGGRSLAHVVCGDLNSFERDDLGAEAWREVCAHYEARGWSAPAGESFVLRELRARGFADTFVLASRKGELSADELRSDEGGAPRLKWRKSSLRTPPRDPPRPTKKT